MSSFSNMRALQDLIQIRKSILKASFESSHGHIPTCYSVIELIYAIYSAIKHDPSDPEWPERDIFVLSKGHASLGHYAVLAHFGYLEVSELSTFGQFKTRLGCHADRHKVPGVEASTGSLGHGIGLAVGMALAEKIKGSKKRIVCLIGDGEANEGSVWEAMLVASDNKLDNLTIVCDSNGSQVRCLNIADLDEKMRSFGAETYEIDGHDLNAIQSALMSAQSTVKCINARTKKGYGLKILEDNFLEWHRKSPDSDTFEKMMAEFNA